MLTPIGKVGLWIDPRYEQEIQEVAKKLNKPWKKVSETRDEFGGKSGFKKILIAPSNDPGHRGEL